MKKILVALTLTFYLSSPAQAFAPLLYSAPMLFAFAFHMTAVQGLYWYGKLNSSPSVSSSGNISRPSQVQWVNLNEPSPSVHNKNVTAEMSYAQMKSLAETNPSTYPLLKSALSRYDADPPNINTQVGQTISTPLGFKTVINSIVDSAHNSSGLANQIEYGPTRADVYGAESSYSQYYIKVIHLYYSTNTATPAAVPSTPLQVATAIAGGTAPTTSSLPATTPYQAELDKMFQDPNYIPSFSDDTTGLPYAPPSSSQVATPLQVDSYNKTQQNIESQAALQTAAQTAVTTSQTAVNTAQTARDNAQTAYTAAQNASTVANNNAASNPNDPTLQQAATVANQAATAAGEKLSAAQLSLNNAQSGLSNAITTAAQTTAAQTQQAANDAKNATITSPTFPTAYGDGSTSDFGSRLSSFMSGMKNTAIFSAPRNLIGNIPTGGNSVFHVSFGRMGSTDFDLASYGNSILLIRFLVLAVFSIAAIRIITLKGGSG